MQTQKEDEMVDMILNATTGKRIAVKSRDILEMHEGEVPSRTILLIDHGQNPGENIKPVVVEHDIEEIFAKMTDICGMY